MAAPAFDAVELQRWLTVLKQRVEDNSPTNMTISASQVTTGVFDPERIPPVPFTVVTLDASPRLLGRTSAGAGPAEEIQVAAGLTLTNGLLSLSGFTNGFAIGDLLYADTTHSLARLADVAVGSYVRSGGVATAPLWSTLTLPNAANSGDILKASGANAYASTAPQALTKTNDTNVTLTLGGTPATALVNAASVTAGWTGTLAVSRGGSGIASYAVGDLLYASGATTLSKLSAVAVGSVLVSGGVATAAAWSATPTISALTRSITNGATQVVFDTHDPTITGTIGTVSGDVGGATFERMYQPVAWTNGPVGQTNYVDDVWHYGINLGTLSGGIGRKDTSRPNVALSFESKFYEAGGFFGQEVHLQGVSTDGLTAFRPWSFTLAHDASVITVQYTVDTYFISSRSGDGMAQFSTANAALDLGTSSSPIKVRFTKNNVSAIQQINAAGSAFVDLLFLDNNNVAQIAAPLTIAAARVGQNFVTVNPATANTNDSAIAINVPTLTGTFQGFKLVGTVVGTLQNLIENDDTGGNSHARMLMQVAGASGGDPYCYFNIPGATNWSIGVDNSDSDKFKFGVASTLGAADKIAIDTTGNVALLTGLLSKYNAVATTGWGVPAIYGSGRATGQTAAVSSVATYTVGATDGSFVVSANVNVTTFIAGTFNVTVAYTDETNTAQTLKLNFASLTGTLGIAIAAAGPFEGIRTHIRCKASTAITITTSGTFTSLTYNVEGNITQIS